jgi:hypothetical protein
MDHIGRSISLINNRMYGDYYKLYSIILTQVADPSIMDMTSFATKFKKYTPYKELDPFQEYSTEDTIQLHADILEMIDALHGHYTKKDESAHHYHDTVQARTSITNFLHTLAYENSLLLEQIALYVNYVNFFHSTQHKFLAKLFCKMDGFKREIEEDILNGLGATFSPNISNPPNPPNPLCLASLQDQDTRVVQDASMGDLAIEPFTNAFVNEIGQEVVEEHADNNVKDTSVQEEKQEIVSQNSANDETIQQS